MAAEGVTGQETNEVKASAAGPQSLGDIVAKKTETPLEAKIDAANGLRHSGGRRPTAADFDGLLTPEGNSGDVFGTEIGDNPFVFGETGSTGGV